MKTFTSFGMIALTASLLAAAPDDQAKKDTEALAGKWKLTELMLEGKSLPVELLEDAEAQFTGKLTYKLINPGGTEEGTFTLDTTKSPKTIDFRAETGSGKGNTQLAVYEIDGDTMKFCTKRPGSKERPTSLESKAGVEQMLFVWKRVKE